MWCELTQNFQLFVVYFVGGLDVFNACFLLAYLFEKKTFCTLACRLARVRAKAGATDRRVICCIPASSGS